MDALKYMETVDAIFSEHGYETFNPDWPGDGDTVEGSRANRKEIANHGVTEVAER